MNLHEAKNSQILCYKFAQEQEVLTKEDELAVMKLWLASQDEEALSRLIFAHLRMVHSLVYRFKKYQLPSNDLVQEGVLGLIKAANAFDVHQNCRFATYAKWWVLSFMQDYITRNWSIVRTATNAGQKRIFFRLNQLKKQLSIVNDGEFGENEKKKIADILNTTIANVEEMNQKLSQLDVAFDVTDKKNPHHINSLCNESLDQEHMVLENEQLTTLFDIIDATLMDMPARDSFVLKNRFFTDEPMTLADIGKKLSLTKERVRQIEKIGLRQLKINLVSKGINNNFLNT